MLDTYQKVFIGVFLYRYARLLINLVSFWTFRPIPPPEKPTLEPKDVTVILPTINGDGEDLRLTIETILRTEPYELILVPVESGLKRAQAMVDSMPTTRIRILSVKNPNKRRQMSRAIPEVTTPITIFADDDVRWPRTLLPWMLAPFENETIGGVVTCQRLQPNENPSFVERIWGFLGALYLERRNFDCAATSHIDGGVPCLSGRTVAYRTKILRDDPRFTFEFTNETWWWGRYQLKADDDNFITRWLVSKGWKIYMQYHPECEVKTVFEYNSRFLKQCARWCRSNWRSNLTSLFLENIWTKQPYSTYAVHLTTLSPPALLMDGFIAWLCHAATWSWEPELRRRIFTLLAAWILTSKVIKLLGHYVRYPVDILLIPVSILFGYFHGAIKLYACGTLTVTAWGSRDGADVNDSERMRWLDSTEREQKRSIDIDTLGYQRMPMLEKVVVWPQ